MDSPEEMLHQVGTFEPIDAKKILTLFEAQQIPFEVEPDDTTLDPSGRDLQALFGMNATGSRLAVFVPASALPKAQRILAELFPT